MKFLPVRNDIAQPLGLALGMLFAWPVMAQAQFVAPPALPGQARAPLPLAILSIVNILLILVGVFAAIYLVVSGVRYITSRGDEQAMTQARNGILYAVIGLIVVGLAAAIVRFVIGAIQVS